MSNTPHIRSQEMEKKAHPAKAGSKWIRRERRLGIYIRDGFTCAYCGDDLRGRSPREVTLDHILPHSKGGSNESSNLVTACHACNCSRGNQDLEDFATPGTIARIQTLLQTPVNTALAKSIITGAVPDPRL